MRILIASVILLAACSPKDESSQISIASAPRCEESADVMIRMATACAQGGGKYPEDCMKTAANQFCPDTLLYRITIGDESGPWLRCTEAKSPETRAACARFDR